ncbi:hypothetical protein AgCh_001982 [Apium graveolens]
MEANFKLSSSQSLLLRGGEEKEYINIAAKISEVFHSKLNFFGSSSNQEDENSEVVERDEDSDQTEVTCDNDDKEEEFSFVINSSGSMPISNNIASADAHIRPNFSLFNQDLLLPHKYYTISENLLPSQSQVEKVFIKTSPTTKFHKSKSSYGTSSGPYHGWEKTSPQLSKKSYSTGFSKLWRSQELSHRSRSNSYDNFIVKFYRSQQESIRRGRMKMYAHQSRIQIQNNKLFLASTKN